jgi:hypothetical protein
MAAESAVMMLLTIEVVSSPDARPPAWKSGPVVDTGEVAMKRISLIGYRHV